MNNQQAYDQWAGSYDTVLNKTRDIEAVALRKVLSRMDFKNILEIGCGTGKNTEWLLLKARRLICVDFSTNMLNKAKAKIKADNVEFVQMDIREKWNFNEEPLDLVTCSLMLEHIADIDFVFRQANAVLKKNGLFYIGELHPFKQYGGSKARFETENGTFVLECFVHHLSDFLECAKHNDFDVIEINEFFDEDDRTAIPRLLTMVFKKK